MGLSAEIKIIILKKKNYYHMLIALRLQNKSFDNTCDLIENAITYSDCKNIVLSVVMF